MLRPQCIGNVSYLFRPRAIELPYFYPGRAYLRIAQVTSETKQQVDISNDNTPQQTSVVGLTTFNESTAELHTDDTQSYHSRPISNPYTISDYKSMLQRAFLLASFTWTNATSVTQKFKLLGNFLSSSNALAVFKYYRLLRCTIHIEFKMISSQYHQGSALVGYTTCLNGTEPIDQQSVSSYNAIVLSASKQDGCTFEIPYTSPEDWMDTTVITSTTG